MSRHKPLQQTLDLATCRITDKYFGLDILMVQEITRYMPVTPVPLSAEVVHGVINLRGRIVTVIDLGKKLGLVSGREEEEPKIIIIRSEQDHLGLLVDGIGEVVSVETGGLEPAPANVSGIQGRFFSGVFSSEQHVIGVLNMEQLLKT